MGCDDGESKIAGTRFLPPSCGMAHPAAHCQQCGDFFTVLNPFWTSLGTDLTDNSNVVRVIGQGSTDLCLNDIVLRIISITMEHDISLLPTWVPRDQNKIADGLTHLEDPCDWTLIADVFQKIVAQWGLPTIDRFASHSNHLLDRFNSMLRFPGSVGINALAQRD